MKRMGGIPLALLALLILALLGGQSLLAQPSLDPPLVEPSRPPLRYGLGGGAFLAVIPAASELAAPYDQDPSIDTYVDSAWPSSSYCMEERMAVGYDVDEFGYGRYRRAYVGFGLGSIPANATVTSATFYAYLSESSGAASVTIDLRRVVSDWLCPLDWGDKPKSVVYTDRTVGTAVGWRSWTVTDLVRDYWRGKNFGSSPNFGLELRGPETGGADIYHWRWFHTQNHKDQHPRLVVQYQLPAPTRTATRTQTRTMTPTSTRTPTVSRTPTSTVTFFPTPTRTASSTTVPTKTFTPTPTPTIPPSERPDLEITDIWQDAGRICYQIMNLGPGNAPGGHQTSITLDGAPFATDTIAAPLGPGERLNRCLKLGYQCTAREDAARACADSGDLVQEAAEKNNCRQEVWSCDTQSPTITQGPTVSGITQDGAIVSWTTDEAADGTVRYGTKPGAFDGSASSGLRVTSHQVTLSGLAPSTTYQAVVESADAAGNSASSKGLTFTTPASPDAAKPQVALLDPGVISGMSLLKALASDDTGVSRVQFFVDGNPIWTDYTSPFECTVDASLLSHGTHTFLARAFDLAGNASDTSGLYNVINYPDEYAPTVTIEAPGEGEHVRCTVPITVHAVDSVFPIGHDRSGIRSIEVFIDPPAPGEFWMLPLAASMTERTGPFPMTLDHTEEWNTEDLTLGEHEIMVRVYDGKWNMTEVRQTVHVARCEVRTGEIRVWRTGLWDRGTYFEYTLHVENTSPADGHWVTVEERHEGMQPIPDDSDVRVSIERGGASGDDYGRVAEVYIPIDELPAGAHESFRFRFVPFLTQDDKYATPLVHTLARETTLQYCSQPWCPPVRTEDRSNPVILPPHRSIAGAIDDSRYLLVTDVRSLFAQNPGMVGASDDVLVEMARLAVARDGVLGYLRGSTAAEFLDLIEPGGDWASQLHRRFSQALEGYLLIVGETEVVPSWLVDIPDVSWSGGKVTTHVPFADLPYSDTIGDDDVPDLMVGRMIGNTAVDLLNALETAVGVAETGSWDRTHGLATSGSEGTWEDFQPSASNVMLALAGQMIPRGGGAWALHWTKWVHKEEIGTSDGYDFPLDNREGFVLADTDGDGTPEMVVADPDIDICTVFKHADLDATLTLPWDSFYCQFTPYDGFAAGDIDGDGVDEIIVGIDETDKISVHNDTRSTPGKSWPEFDIGFDPWDVLACGDVWGDGRDEIIVARTAGGGSVTAYEYDTAGASPVLRRRLELNSVDFASRDGFAVGNLSSGHAKDEIVVADESAEEMVVYNTAATVIGRLPCDPVTPFDGIAMGDVDNDGMDEIAFIIDDVVDGKKRLFVFQDDGWYWDAADGAWKFHRGGRAAIYSRYLQFDGARTTSSTTGHDGFGVGDINGDGDAEVVMALGARDRLFVYDGHYSSSWMDRYLPQVARLSRDAEIITLRGHGNPSGCSPFGVAEIGTLDLRANPLVLSLTCLSGNYEGDWSWVVNGSPDNHAGNDEGFAEAFFDQGAVAFIGSTHVSSSDQNNPAGPAFFESWAINEAGGHAFTQYSRDRASTGNSAWEYWVTEYNYYGDPRFGALSSGGAGEEAETPDVAASPPPTSVQVQVPTYVVTTTGDYDSVSIPGGEVLLVEGKPVVPFYGERIPIPAGYQVQDVALVERSAPVTQAGLNLAVTTWYTDGASSGIRAPLALGDEGWYPLRDHEWQTVLNADGSSTLVINIYAFDYNGLTQDARFCPSYRFQITCAASSVAIAELHTDKGAYAQGEPVLIDLTLANAGQAQDLVAEVSIRRQGTEEWVDGLLLASLPALSGDASFSPGWETTGFAPGRYFVDVAVRGAGGELLAHDSALFTLGIWAGKVTSLVGAPRHFRVGDAVDLTLEAENSGTVPLSAMAIVRVVDGSGITVATFRRPFSDLAPGATTMMVARWETQGAQGGEYTLLGYLAYQGMASDVATAAVSTESRIRLPLLLRS